MKKDEALPKPIYILLCFIVIITIVIVVNIERKNNKGDNKNYIDNSVIVLDDSNRYLTITSAINKYNTSIKYEETEELLLMLDKIYVKENKIDSKNVLDKIDKFESNFIVNVREVYQVRTYNNIYIYYVKAKLLETSYNSLVDRYIRDIYYKVTINENSLAFAIAPLEEKDYVGKIGEKDERK